MNELPKLRVGTRVFVQGDESVGIPSWHGKIIKSHSEGKSYEIEDSSGITDEVDARWVTPKRDIDAMDKAQYRDYKKDQKAYEKSLTQVTNQSLDCECDSHLDADVSFDCSCTLKGSNPEGKTLKVSNPQFEVISLKRGRQLDLNR